MSSDLEEPGPPGPPPRSFLRIYAGLVMGALSVGGAAMPILSGLGFTDRTSVPCFVLAAVVGGVGVASFWAVTVTQRWGRAQAVSWLAFPIAVLALLAMVPLLLAASFPEALEFLGSPDRLEVRRNGTALEILFPRPMNEDAINLEIDGLPVPPDWFRTHPQTARWNRLRGRRDRSLLVVDLKDLRAELRLGAIRQIGLNRVSGTPQMLDDSGERLQPQRIDLPPEEPSGRSGR